MIDQVIKLYIATHYALGESREVLAVGLLGWYIHGLIRKPEIPTGYIATIAFIIAGALGNIVDCVFYGKLFGYAGWFFGRVVDMFYFPLIHNSAGEVIFFRPVFNFADSCITCAVIIILLFYMKQLNKG